jgi:hypothetical protein
MIFTDSDPWAELVLSDPPGNDDPPGTSQMLRLRRKDLVSAVMTTWAKSRISHGLLVDRSWLTDPSADVTLVSIVFIYHMYI